MINSMPHMYKAFTDKITEEILASGLSVSLEDYTQKDLSILANLQIGMDTTIRCPVWRAENPYALVIPWPEYLGQKEKESEEFEEDE